ncbi:SLC13 family permease [uncultured Dysosmobacter sp.]|uniref:SLC13 family permease n=1 Tax=uncultured Dysosmobacter sp. TaxID=2591384 RepID=UPI00345CCDA0
MTGNLANINSHDLGNLDARETKTLCILALMLAGWFAGSWISWCNTAAVALIGTALFMMPGIEVFSWKEFNDTIGWDCVLMCGAILGIVSFVQSTGASDWLVGLMLDSVGGFSPIVAIIFMSIIAAVLHALIPNGLPVLTLVIIPFTSLCVSLDINPAIGLMIGTFWCDWAPILPIDALPAMGHSYGHFEAQDYVKQGLIVSAASVIILTILIPLLCNLFMASAAVV